MSATAAARPLVWVDLCSGLGGASQPALDRGWQVTRVDIDARFNPDIVADVRNLPFDQLPRDIDVLWASPPCQEFSKIGLRCFYPNPPEPDLSIANAVCEAIKRLQPRFWWVENVRASRPWLTRIFGPVRANVPGHALWSNQMVLLPNIEPHKNTPNRRLASRGIGSIQPNPEKAVNWTRMRWLGGHHGMTPETAGLVPYEIGEAICRAVEQREGMF